MKNTKKAKKIKHMIDALGKGAREVYLEKHPHGFASNHKIHKSDKAYSRRNKVTDIN